MSVVWKYPLEMQVEQTIEVPFGGKILLVAVQHGNITLWAEVDPGQKRLERKIAIVGTGFEVPPGAVHLGSVVMHAGEFVWHVYEMHP